jgi:hypothetical protein
MSVLLVEYDLYKLLEYFVFYRMPWQGQTDNMIDRYGNYQPTNTNVKMKIMMKYFYKRKTHWHYSISVMNVLDCLFM